MSTQLKCYRCGDFLIGNTPFGIMQPGVAYHIDSNECIAFMQFHVKKVEAELAIYKKACGLLEKTAITFKKQIEDLETEIVSLTT